MKKNNLDKIVVDTNIVFSALLNSNSKIAKILLNSKNHFKFYSCNFLRTELLKHRKKIIDFTKLSPQKLNELEFLLVENISFINEELLPKEIISDTEILLVDIDLKDTPIVALTKYLSAKLWTGDKKLLLGLNDKKFINTYTTLQLLELFDYLERN